MDHNYEMSIENWAHIIELEDSPNHSQSYVNYREPCASALVSLGRSTYYRSKAFSSSVGINNLINAADPILTLMTKLRRITIPPETSILHQNLCHEIRAFENKAQTFDYPAPHIAAAKYVLCALIDELISLTLWPEKDWEKYSLVEIFHKEIWEGYHFFTILERSLQDPSNHLDLLELIYICLRLGYEGKYRGVEKGHLKLQNIIDQLYNVIMHYREEFSRGLLISLEHPQYFPIKKKTYLHLLPPVWIISSLMVITLVIVFSTFYVKLIKSASPISQLLTTLQSPANPTGVLEGSSPVPYSSVN